MPISPTPSTARRTWRFLVMFACILGASGNLAAAILSQRVQRNADRSELAVCAVLRYAEDTLNASTPAQRAKNPEGSKRFERLITDMRATDIRCPSPPED